jgi:hypothetical protein
LKKKSHIGRLLLLDCKTCMKCNNQTDQCSRREGTHTHQGTEEKPDTDIHTHNNKKITNQWRMAGPSPQWGKWASHAHLKRCSLLQAPKSSRGPHPVWCPPSAGWTWWPALTTECSQCEGLTSTWGHIRLCLLPCSHPGSSCSPVLRKGTSWWWVAQERPPGVLALSPLALKEFHLANSHEGNAYCGLWLSY